MPATCASGAYPARLKTIEGRALIGTALHEALSRWSGEVWPANLCALGDSGEDFRLRPCGRAQLDDGALGHCLGIVPGGHDHHEARVSVAADVFDRQEQRR